MCVGAARVKITDLLHTYLRKKYNHRHRESTPSPEALHIDCRGGKVAVVLVNWQWMAVVVRFAVDEGRWHCSPWSVNFGFWWNVFVKMDFLKNRLCLGFLHRLKYLCDILPQFEVIRTNHLNTRHPTNLSQNPSSLHYINLIIGPQFQPQMNQNSSPSPLTASLVLVGGGHAHVHVIKKFGMPHYRNLLRSHGIQVTLITRDVLTPYSGMLPGCLAGMYSYDQIHLDLRRLCAFANVRLIHASAVEISCGNWKVSRHRSSNHVSINGDDNDGDNDDVFKMLYDSHSIGNVFYNASNFIICDDGRPPIRYDCISLDVGCAPSLSNVRRSSRITPVKPIAKFVDRFHAMLDRFQQRQKSSSFSGSSSSNNMDKFRLIVVGGGAGGVEVCLASYRRLNAMRDGGNTGLEISLVTKGSHILPGHNRGVRRLVNESLHECNIKVLTDAEVMDIRDNDGGESKLVISFKSKEEEVLMPFDECLWCTSAGAASWTHNSTPFRTDKGGFILVNDALESCSHYGVFAAGDCATMINHPRPKAGVFAVRAGPPLLENIWRYLTRCKLQTYVPQRDFLSLISLGNGSAVASRGSHLAMKGKYLWIFKDIIDRRWMDQYQILPDMTKNAENEKVPPHIKQEANVLDAFRSSAMRCGGCGAKVGAKTVSRVLKAVHARSNGNFNASSIDYDDCAVIPLPSNGNMYAIHTIDFFRSFVSDPFIFGKCAAIHALSDCHAMGTQPSTALALAVVPFSATEEITEETLITMLSGANDVLSNENCQLVGGHTCEGTECALGFAVNAYISAESKIWQKKGGVVGDSIILTKPIGTGAVFAAEMRAMCRADHVEEALRNMCTSNSVSAVAAREFESAIGEVVVHACTDVTGFGLMGHMLEMLVANDDEHDLDPIGCDLYLDKVPLLEGAKTAIEHGIHSSLFKENYKSRRAVSNHVEAAADWPISYPLLFDPQTAGGLLFFVESGYSTKFVEHLRKCGAQATAIIGVLNSFKNFDKESNTNFCTIGGGRTGQRVNIK